MTMLAEAPASEAPEHLAEPTHGGQPPFNVPAEVSEVETAPGPEAAAGAADAGVTPAPPPEKVGSRALTYEELERHAGQVRDAERVVANAEATWESLKEETAIAKKEYDRTVERLRAVIRSNSPDDAPLFNQPIAESAAKPAEDKPQPLNWYDDFVKEEYDAKNTAGLGNEGLTFTFRIMKNMDGGYCVYGDPELLPQGETVYCPTLADAKAWCEARNGTLWEQGIEPPAVDDDAWRTVRLDTLTPAIKPGKLKQLEEAGIVTVGDVQEFSAEHGEWWTKRISGFGESGHKQIGDAMEAFWAARQKAGEEDAPCKTCGGGPGNPMHHATDHSSEQANQHEYEPGQAPPETNPRQSDISFSEDAQVPDTLKPVCDVKSHLVVNVVQYTSGRWRSDYWVSVGTLDADRKMDGAPTFATREEAALNAIGAVRDALGKVRGTMKGATEKVAQKVVWALESGEKGLESKPRKQSA